MAPERIRRPKDVDARSDIWSLGVALYELLPGAPPFRGESGGEIFAAVLELRPPPLHTGAPEVPAALSAIVAPRMSDHGHPHPRLLQAAYEVPAVRPPDSTARRPRVQANTRPM